MALRGTLVFCTLMGLLLHGVIARACPRSPERHTGLSPSAGRRGPLFPKRLAGITTSELGRASAGSSDLREASASGVQMRALPCSGASGAILYPNKCNSPRKPSGGTTCEGKRLSTWSDDLQPQRMDPEFRRHTPHPVSSTVVASLWAETLDILWPLSKIRVPAPVSA